MTRKKPPEVVETQATKTDITGLGDSVVKLFDKSNNDTLCFVGLQEGENKIFFNKAVTPEQLSAVSEFLGKRKFQRHLSNEDFEKAQKFADRKFA